MRPAPELARAARLRTWAASVDDTRGTGPPTELAFGSGDALGPWWHRLAIDAGGRLRWEELDEEPAWYLVCDGVPVPRALARGAATALDPRWRLVARGTPGRALPPWDLVDRRPGPGGRLAVLDREVAWRTRLTGPQGVELLWCTRVGPAGIHEGPAVLPPTRPVPTFAFGYEGYLRLRTGDDPLAAFDTGGTLDGDLDELLLIAGITSDPAWTVRWHLDPEHAGRLRHTVGALARLGAALEGTGPW